MKKILISLLTLLATFHAEAQITIDPSGNYTEDTTKFKEAFEKSNKANKETIYIKEGEYYINQSMPELKNTVTIIGAEGIVTIHLKNVDRFITLSGINSTVSDLFITGDNSRTSNAVLVKNTSHARLDNIHFSGLNVALEFNFAHDFLALSSLDFFNNGTDFLVERLDATHSESSSFHFRNCIMLHSEKAVDVNVSVANFSFDGCVFAPWSKNTIQPVSFRRPIFQGKITNSRFESKGINFPVDNLYINGNNFSFPAQSLKIESNYFTGTNINNNIKLGKFTKFINIRDNLFKEIPKFCDIVLSKNVQSNNSTLVKSKRVLKICETSKGQ